MTTGRVLSKYPLICDCCVCGVMFSPDMRHGGEYSLQCPRGCKLRRDGIFVLFDGTTEFTKEELGIESKKQGTI
jgi:hypothetical protein